MFRTVTLVVCGLLLTFSTVWAQRLPNEAAYVTLKAGMQADAGAMAFVNVGDMSGAAAYMNGLASPDFYVWKIAVTPAEYTGANGLVWTEVDNLSVGKARIFDWMTAGLTKAFNPSDSNVRAGLGNAFGGTTTATNLIAMAKTKATKAQKILVDVSGGNGTLGNPATMTFNGQLRFQNIVHAFDPNCFPTPNNSCFMD
jgi:hypothetical protein